MSSSIAVSKVVKTTTDDKDSYDVLLKGQMRFDGSEKFHKDDEPSSYSEMAEIELKIKGICQNKLLIENGVFWIGAVKVMDLKDVQTSLDQFTAHDPYRISDHVIEQELWIDAIGSIIDRGNVKTRNEMRAIFLDLEERGRMDSTTFVQFLDNAVSVDELYEESPETIQAIRLFKHGFEFWESRMQVYSGDEIDG